MHAVMIKCRVVYTFNFQPFKGKFIIYDAYDLRLLHNQCRTSKTGGNKEVKNENEYMQIQISFLKKLSQGSSKTQFSKK